MMKVAKRVGVHVRQADENARVVEVVILQVVGVRVVFDQRVAVIAVAAVVIVASAAHA